MNSLLPDPTFDLKLIPVTVINTAENQSATLSRDLSTKNHQRLAPYYGEHRLIS